MRHLDVVMMTGSVEIDNDTAECALRGIAGGEQTSRAPT